MALADRILRLITRRGEAVTVRRLGGTYNPTTGKVGAAGPTDVVTVGIRRSFRHDQVDGVTIQRSDEQVAIPNNDVLTFEPKKGDFLLIGMTAWSVQNTRAYRRDGVVVAYDLHVRAS